MTFHFKYALQLPDCASVRLTLKLVCLVIPHWLEREQSYRELKENWFKIKLLQ